MLISATVSRKVSEILGSIFCCRISAPSLKKKKELFRQRALFACAQGREDLLQMNQSPPANSPSRLKDNHGLSHHEALVFCSALSPGRQGTHHGRAVTLRRASCARAFVLQSSGERCEDKGITVGLLWIKKIYACVWEEGQFPRIKAVALAISARYSSVGPIFIVYGCPVHCRTLSFLGSIN